ncbi:Fc.00g024490.m01.CDS01 [Cosmosporella sp. VM-42]
MPGRKVALLIGCQLSGLVGVKNDLKVMKELLEPHGFLFIVINDATRKQILEAWEKLIDDTSPGDAVVVYYSGHGSRVKKYENNEKESSEYFQFLVPVDFDKTAEDDWRGIASEEVSGLLGRTTDKTKNVTIILDCCYAARIARLPGTVKTIEIEPREEISKHVRKILDKGKMKFSIERNPHAVSIVASTETASAYETRVQGVPMSVLVAALQKSSLRLENANSRPKSSWRSIILQVRDHINAHSGQQYPQVEGDDLRFPFSLDRANPNSPISVSFYGEDKDGMLLEAGDLHGVRQGDSYVVLPSGVEQLDGTREHEEVVVTHVRALQSRAGFSQTTGFIQQSENDSFRAFLKKRGLGGFPVVLKKNEVIEKLREPIAKSISLTVSDEDDSSALATVQQRNDRIELVGYVAALPFFLRCWPLEGRDTDWVADCVSTLESFARARHLLTLPEDRMSETLKVHVEAGKVELKSCCPWSESTPVMHEGEKLYVKITNTGPSKVYVFIFDVRAESTTLLSTRCPSGRALEAKEEYSRTEKFRPIHLPRVQHHDCRDCYYNFKHTQLHKQCLLGHQKSTIALIRGLRLYIPIFLAFQLKRWLRNMTFPAMQSTASSNATNIRRVQLANHAQGARLS